MKRLLLVLLFAGCQPVEDNTQRVKLTLVADTKGVIQHCGKDNAVFEPTGCAKQGKSSINPDGLCEIVVIKPRDYEDRFGMENLGHELWHCFKGPVHK